MQGLSTTLLDTVKHKGMFMGNQYYDLELLKNWITLSNLVTICIKICFLLSGKIITVMFQNSDTLMFYQILIPYMLSIILNNVMMINIKWHNNILNVFKNHFWEIVRELYLLQRLLIELVLIN